MACLRHFSKVPQDDPERPRVSQLKVSSQSLPGSSHTVTPSAAHRLPRKGPPAFRAAVTPRTRAEPRSTTPPRVKNASLAGTGELRTFPLIKSLQRMVRSNGERENNIVHKKHRISPGDNAPLVSRRQNAERATARRQRSQTRDCWRGGRRPAQRVEKLHKSDCGSR